MRHPRRGFSTVLLVAALLAGPDAAGAQQGSAAERQETERELVTLPNVSDVMRPGYYLVLEADSDQRVGTASVAFENASGSFTTTLSLRSPLDDNLEATPVSLDGVATDGEVSVGLHWFHWPGRPDAAAMRRMCRDVLGVEECDDDAFTDPAQRAAFLRLARAGAPPIIANVKATVGRDGFTYVERPALASQSVTEGRWSAEFSLGRYAPRTGYIAAGYRRQVRFGAASGEIELCQPLDGTAALSCEGAVIGAPSKRTLNMIDAEWRLFLPGGKMAINPSVVRDFTDGITAIDVPLYFLSSSTGGLAGGARASWRSDTKDFAVGVFVGTALGLTR